MTEDVPVGKRLLASGVVEGGGPWSVGMLGPTRRSGLFVVVGSAVGVMCVSNWSRGMDVLLLAIRSVGAVSMYTVNMGMGWASAPRKLVPGSMFQEACSRMHVPYVR